MRYQVNRDKRRRRLFYLSEEARVFFRIGFFECRFNKKTRALFYKDLVKTQTGTSFTKIKNRCVITGRGSGVLRDFRLSRIQFRELALNGHLPGVRKSSW